MKNNKLEEQQIFQGITFYAKDGEVSWEYYFI